MSLNKQAVLRIMAVFILMSVILCCVCYCSPVSYRDEIVEVTTTPKTYQDRFTYRLQQKTKTPPNNSFTDNGDELDFNFRERNKEFVNENYSKVKSVMPGEKTLRQSDDDDDDDDDGGEYEGFDYSGGDKSDRRKLQQCSRPDAPVGAMPMMIIREVDMVAVQIPVKDPHSSQSAQAKDWSEWSPCSRPCRGGKGLQSRWRVQHGLPDREQQFRPCYLADCSSREFQFRPSFP